MDKKQAKEWFMKGFNITAEGCNAEYGINVEKVKEKFEKIYEEEK